MTKGRTGGTTEGMTEGRIKVSSLIRATRLGEPGDIDVAWDAVDRRLVARASSRWRRRTGRLAIGVPVLAAAAGAVILVVSLTRPGRAPTIEAGGAFESADREVALALPDGIQVDLGRQSRLGLESVAGDEIRVTLGRGSAHFDVEPRHARRFVVDADDVEVRVVGTRFRVTRVEPEGGDAARVEVAVDRGIVEVRDRRHATEPHRLRAGERFSMPAVLQDEPALAPVPAGARSGAAGGGPAALPESVTGVRAREAAVSPAARADGGGATRPPRSAASAASAASGPASASARALLEQAQERWRAGRMTEAAALYEQVLARHPTDARAALAALELGRIQMDHLRDLPGAIVSLERALRLAPHAAFHEDALARLAQANARLGRKAECRRARDAYVRQYAQGIHVTLVSKLCE